MGEGREGEGEDTHVRPGQEEWKKIFGMLIYGPRNFHSCSIRFNCGGNLGSHS